MARLKIRQAGAWVDTNRRGKVNYQGSDVTFAPPSGGAPVTFFTDEVPVNLDAADSSAYTLGTYMSSSVPGTVTHIRWPFPITAQPGGVAPKANIFRVSDGAKLGGADVSFAMPGTRSTSGVPAWNVVALATPVHFAADEMFCAAVYTPLRYVVTGGFFGTTVTKGVLTAPAVAGRFVENSPNTVTFPTGSFGNGAYFPDVVFIPD